MYTGSSLSKFAFKTTLFLLATGVLFPAHAKEGMWPAHDLKSKEMDMRSMGLQIPVEKLYNSDGSGLNNAVVLFGKGCTGEVISSHGLILTNHHCGYGTVQGLSNKDNDYFANGFWAMNMQQEIPCPGLTVTFIRKMENVTETILANTNEIQEEHIRDSVIDIKIKKLEATFKGATHMDATVRSMYNGNQYWVVISETFKDVRLVGFPPNGIGAFGGDSDNWMWPRYTGDFSLFRVYAGANNKPSDYSSSNKPYNPKEYFTISTKGYKEGDFTMVYGFPASSQEYIASSQLNQIASILDPIRVSVRTQKLNIWTKNMQQSRDIFLKYTSKRAGVANGWKKWQGEMKGLRDNQVMSKKEEFEKAFDVWSIRNSDAPTFAANLVNRINAVTSAADTAIKVDEYIKEAVLGIELIDQGAALDRMLQCFRAHLSPADLQDSIGKLAKAMDGFYKNYDPNVDEQIFAALMPLYMANCPKYVPVFYQNMYQQNGYDFDKWADNIYHVSLIARPNKFKKFVTSVTLADSVKILSDPSWQLYTAINTVRQTKTIPVINEYKERIRHYNRLFMNAQMIKDKHKDFYPDANQTLRLTYGKVQGIDPEGPAGYSFQTNLNEAITKDNPSVDEYKMPEQLKELYKTKNYGRWNVNGTVPIAFTASNHTSGGNSGSPVLNAHGELIGTNFDRVYEGTMSDLYYDPKVCRNITLDIRYTLFIIDKFGKAGWLLDEMNFSNATTSKVRKVKMISKDSTVTKVPMPEVGKDKSGSKKAPEKNNTTTANAAPKPNSNK
jgi:Peptidase S46